MSEKIDLVCPSGVGDVAWIISSLWSVRDQLGRVDICQGWPHRTKEFVQLLGFESDYVETRYEEICGFEAMNGLWHTQSPTWEKVRNVLGRPIRIEANKHLEAGKPLATWLPDLVPEYHPPFDIPIADNARVRIYLDRAMESHPMKEGPVVGISCASYRGAEAWKTWGLAEWKDMLRRIMSIGWRPVLIGGSWDDLTFACSCDLKLPELVGKTAPGAQMVTLCDQLDSYIGFSSGLNVVRTMLNKPALALWPVHQEALSRSWAPPKMLESRRYVASQWLPPKEVWPVAKQFLRLCEKEIGFRWPKPGEKGKEKLNGGDHAEIGNDA